jgi:maltose O-acetyltransferase
MRQQLKRVSFDALLFVANQIVAHIPSHLMRLWFYRHAMGFQIGPGSSIFMGAWVDAKRGLKMGSNSTVNQRCRLDTRGGITIGDNVSISAEVCILTADHDMQSETNAGRQRPVSIEDHVFIGTRAMILPGVTLAKGAAVGAGAIVTRDVPAFTIVAGAPARPIGARNPNLNYKVRYRRLFF